MHLLPRGFPSVFFIFVCAVVCGKDGDAYHLNLCYQPIECGDTFHIKETGIEFIDDYGMLPCWSFYINIRKTNYI